MTGALRLPVSAHPIFASFAAYDGPRDPEIWVDWVGARFPRRLVAPWPALFAQEASFPSIDEEYFEWIDLLAAVANANDRFVMVELGAGFGRWGIRAAHAARQRAIGNVEIRFVEAEPQHAEWLRESLALNHLPGFRPSVLEAAVSYAGRPVAFAVEVPGLDALNWYGQHVAPEPGTRTERSYFGRGVFVEGERASIHVEALTLAEILEGLDVIDFLDADIQGAEDEMVRHGIETLTARVRRVHIGTHSSEIEDGIRSAFNQAGWRPVWDFPGHRSVATDFGEVFFGDGIQTWTNPRLRG